MSKLLEHRGYQSGMGQVIGLLSIFLAAALGLTPWLWATVATYFVVGLCITVGFHRLFSHLSFRTSPAWELALLCGGTVAASGSSIQWNIAHQAHHKYSDREGDPHNVRDLSSMWLFNYAYPKYDMKMVRRMLSESHWPQLHLWMHHHFWLLHGCLVLVLALIDWHLLFYGYMLPVGMLLIMGGAHNVLAHWGKRPRDIWWYAPFSLGEWNHKRHHDLPSSPRFGALDPGWWVIKAIRC